MLRDVQKRLAEEELTLTLDAAAVDFLVDRGYDDKFGARPLKRTIQRYVEDALSEKILMGEFARGDEIAVSVSEDGESLVFQAVSHSSAT
jgi:ATP-dependent Clp protease ATP-binding subunit ClpC